MKIIFMCAWYYTGPVKHLYRIFEIFKALGDVFRIVGIEVKYFARHNEVIPLQDTLTEEQFTEEMKTTDLVFMWNGSLGKEQELSEYCKKEGIPVYYAELGWLPQRGTFYFDRKGTNCESSLLDWLHRELTKQEKSIVDTKIFYYKNKISQKTNVHKFKPEENYIFVPLQVEADSQIVRHSPNIKKMQELLNYVSKFTDQKIIFKQHPKDPKEGLIAPENCKIVSGGSIKDFIDRPECKGVVTINSTVGVEALVYNKPVITLGKAFYEGRGLTYIVRDDETMVEAMAWLEKGEVATGVIQAFLHYLTEKQWQQVDLNNKQKILGLIENITDRGQV